MHMKRCFRAEAIWKIVIHFHHVFGVKNEYDILLPCMLEVQPIQKRRKSRNSKLNGVLIGLRFPWSFAVFPRTD